MLVHGFIRLHGVSIPYNSDLRMIGGLDSLCPNAGFSQPIRRTFAGVALDFHGAPFVGVALLLPPLVPRLDLPLARAVALHEAVAVDLGALLLGKDLGADLQF